MDENQIYFNVYTIFRGWIILKEIFSMGPSKNKTSRETNQQRQKFVYNHFLF